jgi:hypothetical protein
MVSFIVMPQLFPPTSSSSHALQQDMPDPRRDLHRFDPSRKRSSSVLRTLHKIGGWLRRDEVDPALPDESSHQDLQKQASNDHLESTQESGNNGSIQQESVLAPSRLQEDSLLDRTLSKSKKVVPELSRQFTTKRQNSEKRERRTATSSNEYWTLSISSISYFTISLSTRYQYSGTYALAICRQPCRELL